MSEYCPKCLMTKNHPSVIFNEEGICYGCINYENRKNIDWKKRWNKLRSICSANKKNNNEYDVIIPVSGGKDSHYLVHVIKNEMGMNPLLVTVGDPFTKTIAGNHNLVNLKETFNCDHIQYTVGNETFRKATRTAFQETGEPLKYIEVAIYTVPLKLALALGVKLIVYGENSAYEYGSTKQEMMYANVYIKNLFDSVDFNFWINDAKLSEQELYPLVEPSDGIESWPKILFMSYFSPWSSIKHLNIAKKYGFRSAHHEWDREGTVEKFEQIDSLAYLVHLWLKYAKFGFSRATDIVSRRIREGELSVEEGKRLILEHDHKLDERSMFDFINFCKYTPKEFWDIVNKWYNKDLFEIGEFGNWVLKQRRF